MNVSSEISQIAKPEFLASTPKRKSLREQYQSFCTSNESRGYGTMKSSHFPTSKKTLKPVPSGVISPVYADRSGHFSSLDLSSSPEAKIPAPPCSIQDSETESESDIFWPNEFDQDLDQTPTNVPPFRLTHHLASIDLSVDLDQPLQCPICPSTFATDQAYSRHQEEHLKSLGTPLRTSVSCRHCQKKFKSKLKLKRHHDKHHPAEMKVLMVL
ncbi:Oidioi.mRNA.OKI2018_I69.chr1.g3905.t1.cds [Oikopleura dioica]|uniref:Oidioi.mRNA.OKI2018_I69.chr1.g3905.t1.cds n=1 Tax=Oikopleura dioica TaxID=34765 RepID=A0ABN7SZV8_OIKDI|nr:Oidioi.mRNA.OKI2018_I69.chr1.g3905.t1.cds [Oikopleura dioica]